MDTHTIFELPPQIAGVPTVFRLNRRSVVRVGDFSFRNPPLFMPTLADVTRFTPQTFPSTSQSGRQPAENENSALIDPRALTICSSIRIRHRLWHSD
jgi:hypothetical protein